MSKDDTPDNNSSHIHNKILTEFIEYSGYRYIDRNELLYRISIKTSRFSRILFDRLYSEKSILIFILLALTAIFANVLDSICHKFIIKYSYDLEGFTILLSLVLLNLYITLYPLGAVLWRERQLLCRSFSLRYIAQGIFTFVCYLGTLYLAAHLFISTIDSLQPLAKLISDILEPFIFSNDDIIFGFLYIVVFAIVAWVLLVVIIIQFGKAHHFNVRIRGLAITNHLSPIICMFIPILFLKIQEVDEIEKGMLTLTYTGFVMLNFYIAYLELYFLNMKSKLRKYPNLNRYYKENIANKQ